MKLAYLVPIAAVVIAANASANGRIWRCGNTYTNDEALSKNCKLVEGGNVTVVLGTKVHNTSAPAPNAGVKVATAPQAVVAPNPNHRIEAGEQRTRDGEARGILEAELKKAESRLDELIKEYRNGEPEKLGPEHRNHQKYIDRVAELKTNINRTENDIAGLKRELGRAK